jgi:Putative auto-transporter adhesin, head GIN domain
MKRILFGFILLAMAAVSNAQGTTHKNYVVAKPGSISTLRIDGNINVTLVVAPNEPNVLIDGSENFTKNVKATFEDGVISIRAHAASKSENDVVVVYAPSLSELELNGDVKFKTIGTVNADNLQLSINGNCKLLVQHSGKLDITIDDKYELIEEKVMRPRTK